MRGCVKEADLSPTAWIGDGAKEESFLCVPRVFARGKCIARAGGPTGAQRHGCWRLARNLGLASPDVHSQLSAQYLMEYSVRNSTGHDHLQRCPE